MKTLELREEFTIVDKHISNDAQPFIIAEAGSNFNQSLDTAYRLIDVAAAAGVDAVKFQLFRAELLVPQDSEQYKIFKACELNPDWVDRLNKHCQEQGVLYMASAFDKASVDVLEAIEVCAHKVASSEVTNLSLLGYIASKKRPMLVSTGMCDMVDVYEAIHVCLSKENYTLALLQCGSVYPLDSAQANLKVMDLYRDNFNLPIGFSDHTLGVNVAIAAVARGASIIEKHFTLDRNSEGPDHFYALEPDELKNLVASIQEVHDAIGVKEKELLPSEREYGRREGLYARNDIVSGKVIVSNDIETKRPAIGIRARYYNQVLGAGVNKTIKQGSPLDWNDIVW